MTRTHHVIENAARRYTVTDYDGAPVAYVYANLLLQVDAPFLAPGDYIVFPPEGAPIALHLTAARVRYGRAPENASSVRANYLAAK